MVRPAPAATRSVHVLDFIAAHPGQQFTLSEIARALELNPASVLSILQSLSDGGYVTRHPRHKTYALGPALVVLGRGALLEHHSIDVAVAEMESLAADLGTEAALSTNVGEDILILATEGKPRSSTNEVRVGARLPYSAPFGSVLAAWSGDHAIETWVARALPDPAPGVTEGLRANLRVVRDRGCSVGLDSPARARLGALLQELIDRPMDVDLRAKSAALIAEFAPSYLLDQIEPGVRYPVSVVSAPVFGMDGEVLYEMAVTGLTQPTTGEELPAIVQRLKAAVSVVTKGTHGRARFES